MSASSLPASSALSPSSDQEKPWKRGFWNLFAVQFQGALSDNIYKFLVIFFIQEQFTEKFELYIAITLAIFSLPFLLFSMAAGFLADRYPKRHLIIGAKTMEIVIMSVGALSLVTQSLGLMWAVVFLMSTQSTFFSPAKYGSMPEILPESRLSWGNGILSLGTFMAIILGGVVAGVLSESLPDHRLFWGGLLIVLALMGWWMSRWLPKIAAAAPNKRFRMNFLADLGANLGKMSQDRVLWLAVLGGTFFWFLAALFGEPALVFYNKYLLELEDDAFSILKASLAIGIALGSVVAGFVSGRKIEYGLVPLGALGLTLAACLMAVPDLSPRSVGAILGMLGVAGGFYIVPLAAIVQQRPSAEDKGSMVATNGWMTSLGVFLASGAFWLLSEPLALSPTQVYLVGGALTFAATLYAVWLVPDSLMRLLIWALTHTLYRVRVLHRQRIPEKGGALFVSNHLSLADACFLIASTDRHIRFLMAESMYRKWWLYPWARMLKVIPIAADLGPKALMQALKEASEWINQGNVVCVFAEGQVTRTGQMLPFRKGMIRIMKYADPSVPIIPVHLDNVWGSIFSFERGKFYWKRPHRLPYPVTVSYGEALPASASPHEVRQAVQHLGVEAWEQRRRRLRPLGTCFIKTARRHRFRFAMTDASSPRLPFHAVLTRAVFLGRRLRPEWEEEENVGILLPPSVPGALVNYAAWMMGKVPVNLNYTLSKEALESCISQCGLTRVLSSKKFLDHLGIDLPVPVVALEDVMAPAPRWSEKLVALLAAWGVPSRWVPSLLGCRRRPQLDDLATVIFSSGSTGDPKGVMLSHYNIVSNVQQLNQILAFGEDDAFVGILPFFHSFGFTATLGLPALNGVGVGYQANPLDGKGVGAMVEKHRLTFLLATPTFLQIYLRSCRREQLESLRMVVTGAEKLPQRLAEAFEKRFGIRPLEGYGCTECAPGVAANTRSFEVGEEVQLGGKEGTVGQPLPGMAVKVVDPETFEELPLGQAGLLLVKGPNVMPGYLGRPDLTEKALRDGWYVTGDIVAVDADGFLTITDRLSRFSKIGGEMVPHIGVEEALHALAGVTEPTFAVTGLPDERKGERLVVVHTLDEEALAPVLKKLAESDLPNLWRPKPNQFHRVEVLPYLGSGKLDLRGVKALAEGARPT